MQSRARRPQRGFTLIEMLIVMVVLSIVAGVAIPRLDFTGLRADAGARMLRVEMSQASRRAVLKQHDVIVGFDLTRSRLVIHEDANNNGAVDAGERITRRPVEDGIGFGVPAKGVAGTTPAAAVTGANLKTISGFPSVIFRRDGAASTSVELYLTSGRAKSTDYRGVSVTKSTARVDWYRYTKTGWQKGGV